MIIQITDKEMEKLLEFIDKGGKTIRLQSQTENIKVEIKQKKQVKQMQENEVSDYEKEKAMNDLQREAFITKVLAELTVDLTVCKLMSDEPLKEWKIYLEKFKKEIDNLYERVRNK